MAEATKTPIEPGLVARIAGGIRYAFTGQAPSWFGPQEPLAAVVPDQEKDSVQGRQFDFPVGFNTRTQPRSGEPVTFEQMRGLADGYDLLRLVIETRKDQVAKLEWAFKVRGELTKPDARCDTLERFFRSPDKENNWESWLRLLLEDLFVIDAPTLYIRKTKGGQFYSLEAIDGATIKRVIDDHGRTPLPPDPAYQQILKGVPAVDYTREELIYKPRNLRTHKVYGFSPVEQIIMTVNLALRRQLNQLSYYTEGNTPNLIFGVPDNWNPDQIKMFQRWWDELNTGGSKHSAKFVPGGIAPHDTKPAALKDEMEEWLARIVCYAFSVSPQPFIKEMNRATAQTGHSAALSEGLAPIMQWVKGLIDQIVLQCFGWDDIEFSWENIQPVSATEQATIDKTYVEAGIMHPDEVRHRMNLPPLTPEQKDDLKPKPAPVAINAAKPDQQTPTSDKVNKAKKAVRPIDRERKAIVGARGAIAEQVSDFFRIKVKAADEALAGEEISEAITSDLLDNLTTGWDELRVAIEPELESAAESGAEAALEQVGVIDIDVLNLANSQAIRYAEDRAAEMVGMKWVDGVLIENPNARWAITETTRDALKSLVKKSLEEGWDSGQFVSEIEKQVFSKSRAEIIARTETAFADVLGNLAGYQESGLVDGKIWMLGSETCCPICEINADSGVVDLADMFPDGTLGPPGHPNCVCDLLPVLKDDEE